VLAGEEPGREAAGAEQLLETLHEVFAVLGRERRRQAHEWPPGRLTMPQFKVLLLLVRPWWAFHHGLSRSAGGEGRSRDGPNHRSAGGPGDHTSEPGPGADRSLTVGSLARILGLSAPTVSGIVDRLCRSGLVERRRSHPDRRVIELVVTPKGRELVSELFAAREEGLRRLFAAMEPEDARALLQGLRGLRRAALELMGPQA